MGPPTTPVPQATHHLNPALGQFVIQYALFSVLIQLTRVLNSENLFYLLFTSSVSSSYLKIVCKNALISLPPLDPCMLMSGSLRADRPHKTYESNFMHHDFAQFGKQHSRYKAILPSIVLSQQCCEAYFIPRTVEN